MAARAQAGKVALERREDLLARAEQNPRNTWVFVRISFQDLGLDFRVVSHPRVLNRVCMLLSRRATPMQAGKVALERREDLLARAEPRICAFDIETTKLPLQFPNAEYDQARLIRPLGC